MVFDFQLPKDKPLVWYATNEDDERLLEPTWLSVPAGVSLEKACKMVDEELDPKDWELAKGNWLMGFDEYRRKEDEQEGSSETSKG